MIDANELDNANGTTVTYTDAHGTFAYVQTAYRDFTWSILLELEGYRQYAYQDTARGDQLVTIGVGFNIEDNDVALDEVLKRLGYKPDLMNNNGEVLNLYMRTVARAIPQDAPEDQVAQAMTDGLRAFLGNYTVEFKFGDATSTADVEAQYRPVWDRLFGTYQNAVVADVEGLPTSREQAVLISLQYQNANLVGDKLEAAILGGDRAEAWYEIRYNSNADGQHGQRRLVESQIFGLYQELSDDYRPTIGEALLAFRMFTKHELDIVQYDKNFGDVTGDADNSLADIEGNMAARGLDGDLGRVEERAGSLLPAFNVAMEWWQGLRDGMQEELAAGGIDAEAFASTTLHNIFVATNAGAGGEETAPHLVDRASEDSNNAIILWNDSNDGKTKGGDIAIRNNDLIVGSLDDASPGRLGGGDDTLKGGLGNDVILDDGGADELFGGEGDDLLIAGAGNDKLDGGEGDDWLLGGEGDDTLIGGKGEDFLSGGQGNDTLVWQGSTSARIELTDRTQDGSGVIKVLDDGLGGTDTITGIEAIKTADGADILQIDTGSMLLFKDAGIDLGKNTGGRSPAAARGASGDLIDLSLLQKAAAIDFSDAQWQSIRFTDGERPEDQITIKNAEDAIGTAYDDIIVLSAAKNYVEGGQGNDIIGALKIDEGSGERIQAGGSDIVHAGEGDDMAWGGKANDLILGDGGNDAIWGGKGIDILMGGDGDDVLHGDDDDQIDILDGGAGNDEFHIGVGDIVTNLDAGDKLFINGVEFKGGIFWQSAAEDARVKFKTETGGTSFFPEFFYVASDGTGSDGGNEMRLFLPGQSGVAYILSTNDVLESDTYTHELIDYGTPSFNHRDTWTSLGGQFTYISNGYLDYEADGNTVILNPESAAISFEYFRQFEAGYGTLPGQDYITTHADLWAQFGFLESLGYDWFYTETWDLANLRPVGAAGGWGGGLPSSQDGMAGTPSGAGSHVAGASGLIAQNPLAGATMMFDIGNDGIAIEDKAASPAHFDFDGDGFAEAVSWNAGADGILAVDADGSGRIENGAELIAANAAGANATSRAIATLDSNGDGVIDAADADFSKLQIWVDADRDGFTDEGELTGLSDLDIQAIDVATSTFLLAGGATQAIAGQSADRDSIDTIYAQDFDFDPRVAAFPVLRGYGSVANFDIAASIDTSLLIQAQRAYTYLDTGSTADFLSAFPDLLLGWTGAQATAPDALGPNIDARHVAAIANLLGGDFEALAAAIGQMDAGAAMQWAAAWNDIFAADLTRALFQKSIAGSLANAHYDVGSDSIVGAASAAEFAQAIADLAARAPQSGSDAACLHWIMMTQALDDIAPGLGLTAADYEGALATAIAGSGLSLTLADVRAANLVVGGSASETLFGTGGSDWFLGAKGADTLVGGAGDDIYIVADSTDVVVEAPGEGIDEVRASVTTTLADNVENLILRGSSHANGLGNALDNVIVGNYGYNTLEGAEGNDIIEGGAGYDTMRGGDGEDVIRGEAGNDIIEGGDGNDVIVGGLGLDTLTGGGGRDMFVFASTAEIIQFGETITDFQTGAGGDVLDLSALLESIGYAGGDPFADGFLRFQASGPNTSVQMDENGAAGGLAFAAVVLLQNATLTQNDTLNYIV
jgi:Ca2+-binding RTX toxin-like protein